MRAANQSVAVPLITIAPGSTNVSISGGTLDGRGANITGVFASAASRVNIDKVIVKNFGSDGISLNGNGNATFDNEMTATRSDVFGNRGAGIHIQNSTQSTVLDNNCHDNGTGIQISSAWANIAIIPATTTRLGLTLPEAMTTWSPITCAIGTASAFTPAPRTA